MQQNHGVSSGISSDLEVAGDGFTLLLLLKQVNPFPNLIYAIPQAYLQVSAMLVRAVLF